MIRAVSAMLAVVLTTAVAWGQVVFSDDFEAYQSQQGFEAYDNPNDLFDPIWLTPNVWHGQVAPPNLQLINVQTPYNPPAPYFPQPPDAKARTGVQSLWLKAGAHRANFVNLSTPLGLGGYVNWWFYDTGSQGVQANAWLELLCYANGLLDVGAGVTTGQVEAFSLGAASFDPVANRNLYQIRGDVSDPQYYPPDSFANSGGGAATWANFPNTSRSVGWHQAAIWLWKPDEVMYIVDGVYRSAPRNSVYGATTVRIRGLASNVTDFYFDDVTVGTGVPPATPRFDTTVRIQSATSVAYANLVLRVKVRYPNATWELDTIEATPDESGVARIPLPPGTWDLAFRAVGSLQTVVRSVTVPTSDTINVSLVFGDADGDNEVSLGDFALLVAAFGAVQGDATYNPACDFDGDGEITLSDFSTLVQNFGLTGDE